MATVQGLRTGQRPLLPNPRQEGRKSEPSGSARQEADKLAETTARTPQSFWQRRMLAQGHWDEVKDSDFVTASKGGPRSVKGASSSPAVVVNSDYESPEKSFSHLEGGEPDTSYRQGAQSNDVFRSETVLMDHHVTTRSTPRYGLYVPRYNTSIKAETERRNHHEM